MTDVPHDADLIAFDKAIDAIVAGTTPIRAANADGKMLEIASVIAVDARQLQQPEASVQAMRREILTRAVTGAGRSRRWSLRTPRVIIVAAISMSLLSVSAWAASHTDTPVGRALRSAGKAIGLVHTEPRRPAAADGMRDAPGSPASGSIPGGDSASNSDSRSPEPGDDTGSDDRHARDRNDGEDGSGRDDRRNSGDDSSRGDSHSGSGGSDDTRSDDAADDSSGGSHGGSSGSSSNSGSSNHSGGSSGSSHSGSSSGGSGSSSGGGSDSGGGGSDDGPDVVEPDDD